MKHKQLPPILTIFNFDSFGVTKKNSFFVSSTKFYSLKRGNHEKTYKPRRVYNETAVG